MEESCPARTIKSPIVSYNNFEASNARQLLHRRSSDEDEDMEDETVDDEDEEEDTIDEEDNIPEEVDELSDEELDEENHVSTKILNLSDTPINHLPSLSTSNSSSELPFRVSWGRGYRSSIAGSPMPPMTPVNFEATPKFERLNSDSVISTQKSDHDSSTPTISPVNPKSAPADYNPISNFDKQYNGNNRYPQTRRMNSYPNQKFYSEKPFDSTLDFSFKASTTKIVFDESPGYSKALQSFRSNRINNEPTRNYPDIWAFCLNSRKTRFFFLSQLKSQLMHSSEIIEPPEVLISPTNQLFSPEGSFWLVFDRRPIFTDTRFNNEIVSNKDDLPITTNMTIVGRVKFFRHVRVILSYGALTSMNDYYFHPEYNYSKQNDWTIVFRPKKFELDRFEEKKIDSEQTVQRFYRRSVLPADLIDRTAIFAIQPHGFNVYICTKGNLHEYKRIQTIKSNETRWQTDRISAQNDDCPIFSTISFQVHINRTSKNNHPFDYDRCSAVDQVKTLFKLFLDFFYSNKISVCFASIKANRGTLTNLPKLSSSFKTPIQIYAFTMLKHVGYSIEQKLSQIQDVFCDLIHKLSQDDDDKFYRLCLHLFRRATEYHFLDLERELHEADKEYKNQLDQCKTFNEKMATILSPPRVNFGYVPSIRITPTTIQVQPLKLVKLHRVLREKNFDDPMSLGLVEIRDEANRALYARDFRSLRDKFRVILTDGLRIYKRRYRYLHHSMSQVKEKQFWFLDSQYSLEDLLCWMGNFDNERVIAKHAARIAQCFTSTVPSIRIPAKYVLYIPDIETEDKQYCFTDGVGRLSQNFFKQVQKALGRRHMPSVLQIRYGGCKGTVSVDPDLDDQQHQLIIRFSMLKFTSDHDELEICKVSSARALYLNRQAILLLSNRRIPDSNFLVLQNENHLWLVQALLCSSIAFELLNDRVGSIYFSFREIAKSFILVEEPFFLQLLITCGHDCVSKFQQRAKIKIAKNRARNMFGIVDERGVLEYGQVFIQYSHINDEKLENNDKPLNNSLTILDNVRVAITKNPCHHPGDLRTFIAVDRPELRHLVDVVVFPQKGPRPHPNEISGSDLDGDEYAVYWSSDLVPTTENDEPYNYDSQEKPIKHHKPVERSDINNIVLDIAEQNLTGDMSNLHLALADYFETDAEDVLYIAGLISQELDAPKTGKHPITIEELNTYRNKLDNRFPDFMMREQCKSYPSKKIIGQLYRSARRAILRWHKASRTHCSLRFLQAAQADEDDNPSLLHQSKSLDSNELSLKLDPLIRHRLSRQEVRWAKNLFSVYRENLKNIISVFNYQDEIDLFCRCEALDQLASGKQDLNISAGLELQRLIETTRRHFYYDFDQVKNDPEYRALHENCSRQPECEQCLEIKLARAAACYYVCYSQAAQQSAKARSRILSFPWLFGTLLAQLKERNLDSKQYPSTSRYIVIGRTMRNIAKQLIENRELKLKLFVSPYDSQNGRIYLRSTRAIEENNAYTFKRDIRENDRCTNEIPLSKILFIEIFNHWIERQKIFGEELDVIDRKPLVPEICWHQLLIEFISSSDNIEDFEQYKIVFQAKNHLTMFERYTQYIEHELATPTNDFDSSMYNYSIELVRICFQLARDHKSIQYAYLSDYLVLALQAIGIEKELNDLPIDIDN